MRTVVFSGRFRPCGTRLTIGAMGLGCVAGLGGFRGAYRPCGTRLTIVALGLGRVAGLGGSWGAYRPYGTRLTIGAMGWSEMLGFGVLGALPSLWDTLDYWCDWLERHAGLGGSRGALAPSGQA
ncbi:hypothetical protein [Paenibacillus sp. 1_12]|uniref:hypothetical protein n=1 Tax=Paenibacillus sp. 1_12 TaxID=1566278 RepID=UPI001160862E|nr:hypothetical protein [Paenibacillus sp. 1_12]